MYSILDFKENLSNIVRPNKFLVYIFPPVIVSDAQISTDGILYYAQSASIPDRNFSEIEIKYYGMSYKLPGGELLQDLVVNFLCDEPWSVRKFFENWANAINSRETNIKGYAADLFNGSYIIVEQLNFRNEKIAAYKYYNIFPKTVDQVELSQETTDTAMTFQVTFSYSYWESV